MWEVPSYRYLTSSIRGLQQFGVIPFEIRSLKIGHTEQRRTQRFYIVAIVRHRGTVGAWRNRGYLRVLLMLLSTSLQSSGLQDFLKCLLPKLSATRTLRLCRSLCLRHLREIVCFHLRPLRDSVWRFYCQTIRLAPYISVTYHSFVFNNPPSSPWLCVTLHQNSKLKRRILSLLLLKPFLLYNLKFLTNIVLFQKY